MPLNSVSFFVSLVGCFVCRSGKRSLGNRYSRESGARNLKRAKLVVVVSVFVLSSFALQNPAGMGQNAPANTTKESKPGAATPAQSVSTQGVPAQVGSAQAPEKIFGFRDFAKQYQVDQEFLASPSPARA